MSPKWRSRRFWMAVTGALLMVLNEGLGLEVPGEIVLPFVALLLGFILGESYVDGQRAKNGG